MSSRRGDRGRVQVAVCSREGAIFVVLRHQVYRVRGRTHWVSLYTDSLDSDDARHIGEVLLKAARSIKDAWRVHMPPREGRN